ncbi:MAG: nucleotide exchange factor GrpE [Deltaproteobacteria bacterium]|nr:nucleotide exchange factor GrpE [Deltaproteobacteria bacterium]
MTEQEAKGGRDGSSGDTDEGGSSKRDERIEQAMAEALSAVESREPPSGPKGTDAASAVTEALIAARKELEEVLAQTRKEASETRDKWLRAAADFENYKKRMAREREDLVKFGNEKLLRDFLPILDDLDRAIQVAQDGSNADAQSLMLDGILMVQKKFISQLERYNVETFKSVGQAFDPNRHEAVQQIVSDLPAGTVAAELQRGFLLSDRLLRPALVTVSLGQPGATAEQPASSEDASATSKANGSANAADGATSHTEAKPE